jgi:hypothetical protein
MILTIPIVGNLAVGGILAHGAITGAERAADAFGQGRYATGIFELGNAYLGAKAAGKHLGQGVSDVQGSWQRGEIQSLARNATSVIAEIWNNTGSKLFDRGYAIGETMPNGLTAGMGPGGAFKGEFETNPLIYQPIKNELQHLTIDLSTSPIEIPVRAIPAAIEQVKPNGDYAQVKFKWIDGNFKYEARWHQKTANAPPSQGDTWVIERVTPGTPEGQRKNTHVLTGENEWTPLHVWKQATIDRRNGVSTPEQEKLLDRGHWLAE